MLVLVIISCFFISCNNRDELQKKKIFSGRFLNYIVDSLPISVTVNPIYWKLNSDNMVICSPINQDGVLSVFSFPAMNYLYSGIRKGRAEGEYLGVNWASSLLDDIITIYDIPNKKMRSYLISSDTLHFRKEYELTEKNQEKNLTMPYVSMLQLDETFFITRASSPNLDQLKLQNMESGQTISMIPELFDRNHNRDQYLDYDYVFAYGNNCLVKAYYYLNRIEIFQRKDDYTFSPRTVVGSSENYERNLDAEDKIVYYQDIFCTNNFIYLLFSGEKEGLNAKSVVEIFDYDGNFVYMISLDRPLSMILLDENNKNLYGFDSFAGPDYVYVYNYE